MTADVPRRENKHSQQRAWRTTKHNVRKNCVTLTRSFRRWSLPHFCLHVMRDGSTVVTQSWWGNNSSYTITAQDAKSLCALTSLTTHGRTLKKLHESATQLPYSVWGEREWLTRANNLPEMKVGSINQERKSANMIWKKEEEMPRKFKMSGPLGGWC